MWNITNNNVVSLYNDDKGQMVQTFSCKLNNYHGCNVKLD